MYGCCVGGGREAKAPSIIGLRLWPKGVFMKSSGKLLMWLGMVFPRRNCF